MNNLNHTDQHDVDEDMMTVLAQGGSWSYGSMTGIVCRDMYHINTGAGIIVASKQKK